MHQQTFIASLSSLSSVATLAFLKNVAIKDGKIEVDGQYKIEHVTNKRFQIKYKLNSNNCSIICLKLKDWGKSLIYEFEC